MNFQTAVILMALLVGTSSVQAKPRGEGGRATLLPHEITNRVQHSDRSRHHEHLGEHHSAAAAGSADHKHTRPAEHSTRLTRQQEEDELLAQELLMHVKPRNVSASLGHLTGASKKKSQVESSNKSRLLKLGKIHSSKSSASTRQARGTRPSNFTKEFKARQANKKYNAKKHTWKKSAHKDKMTRGRQNMKELKEKLTRKEKGMTKEMQKAKALLKKEKALKKKERRERRAKVMGFKKQE